MKPAESDLIAAKAGDREALGRLFMVHYEGLLRQICQQFAGKGMDHDELFQESCLAGMEAVKYFKADRGFKFTTYLGSCVARRLKEQLTRKPWASLPQNATFDQEEMFAQTPCSFEKSDLGKHLGNLTQVEQWVVQLKADGHPSTTIGRRLGLKPATVDSMYADILTYLRGVVSVLGGRAATHAEL